MFEIKRLFSVIFPQVYDLQVKLLKATDQVCDLLMQLSNADLMALLKKNYTTIQNLLLAR